MLARTLKAFEECRLIDTVVVAASEKDILDVKNNIIVPYGFKKVKSLIAGGKRRQDSVRLALDEVVGSLDAGPDDIVVIHDGARPFIRGDIIVDSILAAQEYGASCVAVPAKDTVKIADEGGFISETLERRNLWLIQTPQSFNCNLIIQAYEKAAQDGFYGTDDCMLAERIGARIRLVMGSYDNIKVTTPEDLYIADSLACRINCS